MLVFDKGRGDPAPLETFMRRNYTRDDYLGLIRKIKKTIAGVAITTDCMVGFPGETDINFENTVDLIRQITPLKVHIFPYSRREGTPAAKNYIMEVCPSIIKRRISQLKNVADECSNIFKEKFLNSSLDVLVEVRSKNWLSYWEGHADNYIRVLLESKLDLKNQLISVKIKTIGKDACEGEFC